MYGIYLLLLKVTCLVYTTNCVVYFVVPDDHYLDTDYGNNTLQHYLKNSEKYFTSHTKLIFRPGKHHLHIDMVIQDVQNFTLQGFNLQEMNSTIIYCTRSAHVLINSSDDIIITYLTAHECGVSQGKDSLIPLVALHSYNCSNFVLVNSVFVCQYQQCGLVVANVVGDSYLVNITSSYLLITHNMTRNNSDMVIRNYHHRGHSSYKHRAIAIIFYEHFYLVKVYIIQMKLSLDKAMNISSFTSKGLNEIYIIKMNLTGISVTRYAIAITIIKGDNAPNSFHDNTIHIRHCMFTNINSQDGLGSIFAISVDYGLSISHFLMKHCRFVGINSTVIIRTFAHKAQVGLGTISLLAVIYIQHII